jgi:hypothetical protein
MKPFKHTIRHYDKAKVREPVECMPRQMAPSERFVKRCCASAG